MVSDYEIGYALSGNFGTGGPGPDMIAFANQDPFVPNDMMDWMVGGAAVAAGYTGAYLIGGPAGILRYEAVVPSIAVFAAAVAVSNIAQSSVTARGGRFSTYSPTVTSGFMMV